MGNWERGNARQIRSLPRGEAIVIGAAVNLPAHIRVRPAIPPPDSHDADFGSVWGESPKDPLGPIDSRPTDDPSREEEHVRMIEQP
jgi:hypothetical protein